MSIFQGVPINEYRLLIYYGFAPILIIAALIGIWLCLYNLFGGQDKKAARNLKSLEKRAKTDAVASARFEKLKRKTERRKKRNRSERLWEIGILILLIVVALFTFYVAIARPVTEYIHKDYVVYTGEISVYRYVRHSRIVLDDGTVVWGVGGLTEEDTYGTIVYTRKGKVVLGTSTEPY